MLETKQDRNRIRTQSVETPGTEYAHGPSRRGYSILAALISLDALVLGGLVAMLIVNGVLNTQLDVYVSGQSMAEASTILDLLDNLLPYYMICGAVLLVLGLTTVSTWAWTTIHSPRLRYGVILLCLAVFAVLGMWLSMRGSGEPAIPPMTPTPVAAVMDVVERGF